MKPVLLLLAVSALAFGQVPPMIPTAPDGGPVGGAGNLTTVGSVPYVSASGILNQDAGQFFWDATNNRLGLGKNNPSRTLDVNGLVNIDNGATGGSVVFVTSSGSATTRTYIGNGNGGGYIGYLGSNVFNLDSAGSPMTFTGTAEMARFTAAGNFGIGTTSPVYLLDVANSGASGTFRAYDQTAGTGSTLASFRAGIAQSTNPVLTVNNNANTVVFSVNSTGIATTVGAQVGTSFTDTSTTGVLQLGNASSALSAFITGNTDAYIYKTGSSAGSYPFDGFGNLVLQGRSLDSRDIIFAGGTTPAARMVIKGSGNVGIGTTAPAAPLTVGTAVGSPATNGNAAIINAANTTLSSRGGNLQVITTNSSAVDLGGSIGLGGQYNTLANSVEFASIAGRKENGTAANFAGYLQFVTTADGVAPTEKMRITSAGSVLIGGTTDGAYKLDVQKSGASGTFRAYDQGATGSTYAVFRAGVAQSGNVLEVQNNAGSNVLSVTATGALSSNVSISASGNIQAGATQDLSWSTRSLMNSPASGIITLYNNNYTDFNRLQFGGTTSSFPSIQRSTTKLFFRLADDSAGATVRAGGYESSDGTAGATVTTCTGFKNGLCISGT